MKDKVTTHPHPRLDNELQMLRRRVAELEKAESANKVSTEKLKISEERFRLFFEKIRSGVAVYEAVDNGNDFIFKDLNKAAEKIDKIKKKDVVGKSVLKVFPGVKKFKLFSVFQRVWQTGESEHHPASMYEDERISGWRDNYVYKLPGGEIITVYDDVTRQKQAEAALRDSEAYLRSIFSATPAGIGLVEGRVLKDANRRLCKMLGYRKMELVDQSARMLYPTDEEYESVGREKYCQIEKNGVGTVQTRLKRKDGRIIDVLLSSAPVDQKDHSKGVAFTALDISEQTRVMERLNKISKAVEQSPAVVVITDRDGNIEYVNPRFTYLTGYSRREVLGENPRILKSDKMSPEFYEDLWNVILAGKEWHGEFLNKKKNGELYWEDATIAPIKNEQGEITHFVAVKEDVTEKKKLWDELTEAKERAEESDRLKSCFLANISHEIRTPMNGILGFSKLLSEPLLSGKEKEKYIELIHESGKRMLTIINDIIDISKIEAGEMGLHPVETTVNEVLENIYEFFAPQAEEKGLSISYQCGLSASESVITTDKTRFSQILSNIVNNALKYTKEGGIDFGYRQTDEVLEFYVKDTGIGIPDDQQDKIFERFRQVSLDATREYEGAGLGLSLCKTFVKMLGGAIRVDSTLGKGSTFYFTLPYNSPSADQTRPGKSDKKNDIIFQPGFTVLVVDDDSISRLLLKGVLAGRKANVLVAENGKEAVEKVENEPGIQVVLMDMKMPVMNGYEATKCIKQSQPDLPVIAQTAFVSPSEKEAAMVAGCDAVLPKPIDTGELLTMIQRFSSGE